MAASWQVWQRIEPETLVIRVRPEERAWLIEDAPDIYYVTDYYRQHPVVLVRLSRIEGEALRDLLSMAWRLTVAKGLKRRQTQEWRQRGDIT